MKKTKFNWECPNCGKRNIQPVVFQFDAPKDYSAAWECSKCGRESVIGFRFTVFLRPKPAKP